MSRSGVLVGLVVLLLSGAGCVATKPYVGNAIQKSDEQTRQQLQTVGRRLDMLEREKGEDRVRLQTLEGDVYQVRTLVEKTSEKAAQTQEQAARAEGAARDALEAVSRMVTPKTPGPVAGAPETLLVHFGFADWLLDTPARLTLEKALRRLRENPALMVKVEGYTDTVGSPSQNLKLSQRRADEVARFLIASGIKRNRIEMLAIGEARPIASNQTPTGRNQNRRVAITLLTPAQ